VIGRPDVKWGERPVLIIEPRASYAVDKQRILGALRGKVPDWWIPEELVMVDRMPLAATGKIDKRRLQEELGTAGAAGQAGRG
jgi:fatty-acyl-CoA synthase